jgi:hypothetical protein
MTGRMHENLLRSPPLPVRKQNLTPNKPQNGILQEEIPYSPQHKMIIYLNAWTVILNEVNKP